MKSIRLNVKHQATSLPITLTIATYLLLDKLNVGEMAWGIYISIMVIIWIIAIVSLIVGLVGKHAEIMEDGKIVVE